MKEDEWAEVDIIQIPTKSVASDFGTPRFHEIKDESGVIIKGWCVSGVLCHLDSSTDTHRTR